MNNNNLEIGMNVHVDTDHDEWGRVCSDGEILEINRNNILFNAFSIRANILVPFEDIGRILPQKEDGYLT